MEETTFKRPKDIAYPDALEQKELAIWGKRGEKCRPRPTVGFALSGGGIRSATFCLGVFQALAQRRGLLRKIDYISSVSGGSFFASFYGRLFSRPDIDSDEDRAKRSGQKPTDIEKILSPNSEHRLEFPDEKWKTEIFRWLRENGRYLAPNGGGDLLMAMAVFLRNWLTVQLLVAVSLLAVFLASGLIRLIMPEVRVLENSRIWLSPYLGVAGLMGLFGVVPLGWSYWSFSLRESNVAAASSGISRPTRKPSVFQFGLRGVMVIVCLGLILLAAVLVIESQTQRWDLLLQPTAIIVLELTLVAWRFASLRGSLPGPLPRLSIVLGVLLVAVTASISVAQFATEPQWPRWGPTSIALALMMAGLFWWSTNPKSPGEFINQSEKARNILTRYLRTALFATFAMVAFGLIDSAGQTFYAMSFQSSLLRWLIAFFAAISGAVPFAQSAVALIAPKKKTRPTLSLGVLAGVGAAIIILPFLISIDAFSHAIAYDFKLPKDAPKARTALKATEPQARALSSAPCSCILKVDLKKAEISWTPDSINQSTGCRSFASVTKFLVIATLFSILAGWGWKGSAWVFVNRSSLHPLYAARLIRAYLGASNNLRYGSKVPGISDPVDGDDVAQEEYWRPEGDSFWKKGGPLHLVNVTINETIDGRSQTEQRDRKGVGMAMGPAGISVGVQHHVVFNPIAAEDVAPNQPYKVYPEAGKGDFRVFAPDEKGDDYEGEQLSLGNWTAISGAAVSTGLGSLNSLGASLLTGFFNLRLGYWWDSGTKSITRGNRPTRQIGKLIADLLPAQSSLIDEFQGRFHGTMRRYWYLTDGGHFENLGAYELIRRRLPLIVVIDAAGDPEYNFEDLANLVRKARLDFNAEIKFLKPKNEEGVQDLRTKEEEEDTRLFNEAVAAVTEHFNGPRRELFGTLDQLRRGKWASEPVPERKAFFGSVKQNGLSLRHAALAKITYPDEPLVSHLLLIKPTLIGEEPEDLTNYHLAHPAFPHETTGDQFFDEAQWESYRRLGQHIAEKVFNLP